MKRNLESNHVAEVKEICAHNRAQQQPNENKSYLLGSIVELRLTILGPNF